MAMIEATITTRTTFGIWMMRQREQPRALYLIMSSGLKAAVKRDSVSANTEWRPAIRSIRAHKGSQHYDRFRLIGVALFGDS